MRYRDEDMKTARQRVAIGARLLDEYDRTWFTKIDLMQLNLSSTQECVLGQYAKAKLPGGVERWRSHEYDSLEHALTMTRHLSQQRAESWWAQVVCTADYSIGTQLLGLKPVDCALYGFDAVQDEQGNITGPGYKELELAWIEEIQARNSAEADGESTLVAVDDAPVELVEVD